MTLAFTFQTAGEIAFGRGARLRAADVLGLRARSVLLVHGSRPDAAAWLLDDLTAQGHRVTTTACAREPHLADVKAGVALARDMQADVVLALGGGSVMDMGKAVAGLAPASGDPLDYLEIDGRGRPLSNPALDLIAMPTTAGTGAEVTKNAVITLPDRHRKISLRSPLLLPRVALVDPCLCDHAPPSVTFGSGMDAVTQVIEAYVSCRASPLTDALCLSALADGLSALRALAGGESESARDAIAYASLIGGMALANAGLGAVHGLAGIIGGSTGAPHGEICAALLPHVLVENALLAPQGSVASAKLAHVRSAIAKALGTEDADALHALVAWMESIGMRRIGALGLQSDAMEAVAEQAVEASSSKGNPVALRASDFARILQAAH